MQNVVLTTYFTGKPDPQKRSKDSFAGRLKTWCRRLSKGAFSEEAEIIGPDNFERMLVWYESLIRVRCHGVVFHDCLSPTFVERRTVPQVQFEKYELKTQRSVNDERYICYLEWLEEHPEVERVFLLDLFDVEFFRNPFALMDDAKYDFYAGGDPGEYNDGYNRKKMIRAFGQSFYEDEIKLHAGTCGAPRAAMLRLLKAMATVFDELTARGVMANLNMAVFNKCVYDLFDKERIMHGNPLNSRFKAFERSGDFAIRHK